MYTAAPKKTPQANVATIWEVTAQYTAPLARNPVCIAETEAPSKLALDFFLDTSPGDKKRPPSELPEHTEENLRGAFFLPTIHAG